MPKLNKGQAAVLTPEEFKRLLTVVKSSRYGKRDYLLCLFSFGTGMRVMELAALKISDVLADEQTVIKEISLRKTKGNKQRNVFIADPRIEKALIEYIKERKELSEKKRRIFSFTQPLFITQKGTSFSNKTMQKLFEKLYRAAGIKGASSHSGRRTFATRLIDQGADIRSISILLGHSNVSVTARYFDTNPTRLIKLSALALY
jgi:integrase/recombinase XerD